MKKLMKTVVASAVALVASGAFATLPSQTADFESIAMGEKTVSDLVSNGDDKYWFAITNNNQELSGVVGVVTNDTDQGNFLTLDAQAPVYRTINEVNGSGYGAVVDGLTAETIGTDGIYLDTMVKFTVSSDNTFGDLDTVNDKLAITCYSTDEGDGGPTNILVRAGYVGSSVTPINYVLNIPEDFDINEWHRLTVRAIADVGYASAPVGFAIYLDEELLKYDTSVAAGEQTYTDSLNAAVVENLYNGTTHALLPSLVTSGENLKKLTAVGFKGSGSVDDILFTNDKPSFIVEGQSVTIEWDEGVATYTVVDSNNKTLVDAASTSDAVSTNLTLDAGVTYLTVTATYKTSYEPGTWTKTAGTLSNGVWTFANNGASLKIVSMLPLYEVNGVAYDDLEDAIAAAANEGSELAPATFKLLADCEEGITLTGESTFVIIDLAGHYIQGTDEQSFTISCKQGATVIVTNSIPATGSVKVSLMEDAAVAMQVRDTGTEVSVYDTKFEGYIQVRDAGSLKVYSGIFYDDEATGVEDFRYNAYLQNTPTVTSIGNGYYQVGGSTPEPPAPTLIPVPTAATTLVYDGSEQAGVATGEGYTLGGTYAATNAGEYEATATPDTGYAWSDGTTHTTNISWSIAADSGATVDVTLTLDIAEYSAQLEFPTATATIGGNAVAGTSAWSPDTITEPSAGATNTYEVTFTVTGGNYAGSTGTATFKVFKAAGGGGEDWPADPTEVSGQTAADAFGIAGDLGTADAGVLATWAKAKGVNFADRTTAILEDAFLLDCANTQEAIDEAKANFKVTSITVVGDTVTITPADAADYGNGQIVIEGAAAITSPMSWHTKTTGDKFFRATLVVKPVTP